MAKVVKVIPSIINPLTHLPSIGSNKRRVAGYARVSTDSDEQFTSYEAQVDYYTKYIKAHTEWDFVKVYTDEGISGTNIKKRTGFNEMIADALDGKIDLIVTKSVSRFARNTVDSLVTIRKLKDKGVECFFEKENIYTLDSKGELLITIMSSLAQEESRSISENVTWGQRKAFSDGKVRIATRNFKGFKKDDTGKVVIDEKEAEEVRLIYRLYLDGYSSTAIAKELMKRGIKSPGGKDNWSKVVVDSILTNEKYKGDALLQKRFTVNFLDHKLKKNEGEVPQYYVEKNHEAIIEPAQWDRVQAEMKRRESIGYSFSSKCLFSSKIICSDCGGLYGRKVWHSNDPYRKVVWQCNHKFSNESKCSTPSIDEEIIKGAFIKAYNILSKNKKELIEDCNNMISLITNTADLDSKIIIQQEEVNMIVDRVNAIVKENASTPQDQEEYQKRYDLLSSRFEEENKKLNELINDKNTKLSQKKEMEAFVEIYKSQPETIFEWNEFIFNMMVVNVKVYPSKELGFNFYNGKEVKVEI